MVETSNEKLKRLVGGCVRPNIGPILEERSKINHHFLRREILPAAIFLKSLSRAFADCLLLCGWIKLGQGESIESIQVLRAHT